MTLRTLFFVSLVAVPTMATAQQGTLTLRDALTRADASGFRNRMADGAAATARGEATGALRGILPSLRLEGGFVRTTDPIGAFGTTLRQRAITAADFDPARLNRPDAVENVQAGAVIEQPLFNADAWIGRRAASRGVAARVANAEWTRIATRVDVVRAYYGATLAHERVATLAVAARAAHAHERQAEAMVRQGLVTKSDALLASIGAGEVDAQLADAEAEARTAQRQLAVVLGADRATINGIPDELPAAGHIRAVVSRDTGSNGAGHEAVRDRADLASAALGLEVARLDVRRAQSLYAPRINGVARYDWNSASRLYGGHRSWTVGIMASWSPFAGANEIAEHQMTAGRASAARAASEAAREQALLEAEQSEHALRAALTRLDITERAAARSAEAHRIVGRKYEGGLATVVELLDASATETRSALNFAAARYAVIMAAAERHKALGGDPAALAALDDAPSAIVASPTQTQDQHR